MAIAQGGRESPVLGRVRIVRCYANWRTDAGRPQGRSVLVGHDTREILAKLGYSSGCAQAAEGQLPAVGT
jgi:hypothetical protein